MASNSTPNPFADEPLASKTQPLQSTADAQNPYAAPSSTNDFVGECAIEPAVGVWRHEDMVVLHQSLHLPPRCIWTNMLVEGRQVARLTHNMWTPSDTATIRFEYSLSPHARNQLWLNWLGGVAISLAIATALIGFALWSLSSGWFSLGRSHWAEGIMAALGVYFVYFAMRRGEPLTLVHRDGPYFVLRGARAPFLRSLPPWPGMPSVAAERAKS